MPTAQELPGIGRFVFAAGEATITLDHDQVTVNDTHVHLTPSELRLFTAIAQKLGVAADKQELLARMETSSEDPASINVRITGIRGALRNAHPDAEAILPHGMLAIPAHFYVSPKARPVAQIERFRFMYGGAAIVMYDNGDIFVNDELVELTESEHGVFTFLAVHAGATCTKDMLLRYLYDERGTKRPGYKIIDVFVCKLRKKLVDVDSRICGFVTTEWGRGYVLGNPAAPTAKPADHAPANPGAAVSVGLGIYTREDLPAPGCHWVARRKAVVIRLLERGAVTLEELMARYPDLTEEEIENWRRRLTNAGLPGLRVTKNAA